MEKQKIAAVYIRVSRMGDKDKWKEKESPDTQLEKAKAYAKLKGYTIKYLYQDLDVSGKNDKRPEFQKMFADIKNGHKEIDVVIVYNLSRFARNIIDVNEYLNILDEYKVGFASATEDMLRTDNSMGRLMINIMGSIAQFERERIAETVYNNMINKAKKGFTMGGFGPLGYKTDPETRRYRIVEEEAEVVRLIFDLYLKGNGLPSISRHLEHNKVLGKDSWAQSSIREILINPNYTGDYVYNRRDKKTKARYKDKDDWVIKPNNHPAIVSREKFEIVEKELMERNNGKDNPFYKKGKNGTYILTGKLECGKCGSSCHGRRNRRNKQSPFHYYYACSSKERRHSDTCDQKMVRQEKLDSIVLDTLKDVINNEFIIKLFEETVQATVEEYESEFKKQKQLENMISSLEEKQEALVDKLEEVTSKVAVRKIEERINDIEEEMEELKQELEEMKEEDGYFDIDAFKNYAPMFKQLVGYNEKLNFDVIKLLSLKQQKAIIDEFIDNVVIDHVGGKKFKIDIEYKISKENVTFIKEVINEDVFQVLISDEESEDSFFLKK